MPDTELLTVAETCRRLAISRSTLYELFRNGRLVSVKIGRSRRVSTAALENFIEQQTGAAS